MLLGSEVHPLCSRALLLKQLLTGSAILESIFLPAVSYVIWRLSGQAAAEVDIAATEVRLDGDRSVGHEGLIIATSSAHAACSPPRFHAFLVRSVVDALAFAAAISRPAIGSGFLGVDVAKSRCSSLALVT